VLKAALILTLLTCGAIDPSSAQVPADTVRLDLPAVIVRALEVSPDLLAQRARTRFADARLDEARAGRYLPEFKMTTAHAAAPGLTNPNNTPTGQLYLDPSVRNDWQDLRPFNRVDVDFLQPLWTGGQLSGLIGAAEAGRTYEESGLETTREDVVRRAAEMYYLVLRLSELGRVADEATDVLGKAKDEIKQLLADGSPDVSDGDEFAVLITEQEVRAQVAEVREQSRVARMALRRQLMLDDAVVVMTDRVTLQRDFGPLDSLDTYLSLGLRNRPELAQIDAGVAAYSSLVQVARSDYYPKLFWGVSANYSSAAGRYRQRNPYVGDSFLSRSLETGLGMRMNLNFSQTRSRVKQAQATADQAVAQQSAATQLVLFEVEQAYRGVRYRQVAADAAEEALRLSKEWLRLEQVNFDTFGEGVDDLIKAVQANLKQQAARHEAVFKLNMAHLDLIRAIGLGVDTMAH
jgi:outer membrane protein TolC